MVTIWADTIHHQSNSEELRYHERTQHLRDNLAVLT